MTHAAPAVEPQGPAAFPHAARRICGVDVVPTTADEAVRVLGARLDAGLATRVAFLNAHCVNLAAERDDYRAALGGFVVLADGIGVDLASKLLHGRPFPQNLNGTDFVPYLLQHLDGPMRVALIGGEPGIAQRAAAALGRASPQHVFLPIAHGFFAEGSETSEVLLRLRQARADIVLVALGVPGQELFIARHVTVREARLAIGVGALLDFLAGKVSRAPPVVRSLRLEWAYRLAIEPVRLWKRYLIGNPAFVLRILIEKRRASRQTALRRS